MIKDYSQDSLSFGLEGDGKWQNSEPLTDYNGNNIFDYPANYDSNQGIWYWDNQQEDISSVCYNCSEFIIKGEPAINRIEYIIVGAVNNSNNIVYRKFFLDELRLTAVKKDEGDDFVAAFHNATSFKVDEYVSPIEEPSTEKKTAFDDEFKKII